VTESPPPENTPINVLLVEDEESDRLAVRLQLEVMGLTVTDSASPMEAK
jgi:CheY-like chemotaxis protein